MNMGDKRMLRKIGTIVLEKVNEMELDDSRIFL